MKTVTLKEVELRAALRDAMQELILAAESLEFAGADDAARNALEAADDAARVLRAEHVVRRVGCRERVCTCHDDSAWSDPSAYPNGCAGCGCHRRRG